MFSTRTIEFYLNQLMSFQYIDYTEMTNASILRLARKQV